MSSGDLAKEKHKLANLSTRIDAWINDANRAIQKVGGLKNAQTELDKLIADITKVGGELTKLLTPQNMVDWERQGARTIDDYGTYSPEFKKS
jgi:hypothetical protein